MRCGARCGPEGAEARTWRSGAASGAHAETRLEGLGQGTRRRAHVKHAVHVRDAGCVEDHRLVERRGWGTKTKTPALPSRKEGNKAG